MVVKEAKKQTIGLRRLKERRIQPRCLYVGLKLTLPYQQARLTWSIILECGSVATDESRFTLGERVLSVVPENVRYTDACVLEAGRFRNGL